MGLFGKKKGLVGLDIGSSAVKAVELKSGGKGGAEYQLVNLGMEPLPPEAIVDGAIMDSGAVIDAIQRLFTAQKIKTPDVATSVSGNAVIVKKISLPQMSQEELAESIHWEAEQYIPFDIQDVSLDYEVLEGGGSGGNMDVLLVAVKKDKISDYTSAISQAGKTPADRRRGRVLPPELLRAQLRRGPRPRGGAAERGRLDHEHQHRQGRHLDLQPRHRGGRQPVHRRHPEGPEPLLRPGGGPEEGRAGGGGGSRRTCAPILQAVSENIALEIQKTFDFFKATSSEDRIDRIFLARRHRQAAAACRTSCPTASRRGSEVMNPFNNITYNPREFDPDFINEIGPQAAIAVGLAARKVGDR